MSGEPCSVPFQVVCLQRGGFFQMFLSDYGEVSLSRLLQYVTFESSSLCMSRRNCLVPLSGPTASDLVTPEETCVGKTYHDSCSLHVLLAGHVCIFFMRLCLKAAEGDATPLPSAGGS